MPLILPGSGQAYSNEVRNFSTAQQAFTAATRAIITGTEVRIPARGMKLGDRYSAMFNITKTAAGTATSTYDIATIARDAVVSAANATARVSFTKPAGTAVADEGLVFIEATVRVVGASTGIIVGVFQLAHNLAATGHAQIGTVNVYATSAAFDNSDLGGGYLCVASTTGAADVITSDVVTSQYVQRTTTA